MAQMPALQPRLRAIAGLVPFGTRLVDVGTDHGYLPVYLMKNGRIAAAVATDLRPGPLNHGRRTAAEWGVSDGISFRLCSGLTEVSPGEVDTVVIAGMGGETIAGILDAVPWSRDKMLLLQPMSRAEVLRPWLADHGYTICREELVMDREQIYPILQAAGGAMPPLTVGERYYGLSPTDGPLFIHYLRRWISRLDRAVCGMRSGEETPRLLTLETALRDLREKEALLCVQ